MITVYFKEECGFSQKTLRASKADISVVGQREILTIRYMGDDDVIAQFDMNSVVGWTNYDYDYADDGSEANENDD